MMEAVKHGRFLLDINAGFQAAIIQKYLKTLLPNGMVRFFSKTSASSMQGSCQMTKRYRTVLSVEQLPHDVLTTNFSNIARCAFTPLIESRPLICWSLHWRSIFTRRPGPRQIMTVLIPSVSFSYKLPAAVWTRRSVTVARAVSPILLWPIIYGQDSGTR